MVFGYTEEAISFNYCIIAGFFDIHQVFLRDIYLYIPLLIEIAELVDFFYHYANQLSFCFFTSVPPELNLKLQKDLEREKFLRNEAEKKVKRQSVFRKDSDLRKGQKKENESDKMTKRIAEIEPVIAVKEEQTLQQRRSGSLFCD